MMVMILALLAGCVPSLIIFIRKNKSNTASRSNRRMPYKGVLYEPLKR